MASRVFFRHIFTNRAGDAIQNAALYVYKTGTTTAPSMFSAETGGSTVSNPLLTNNQGEVSCWIAGAEIIDVLHTDNNDQAYYPSDPLTLRNFNDFTETISLAPSPKDIPTINNAKARGAKGDGTTNDAAALQAALNAGNTYLPEGTYGWTGDLTVPASTDFLGEGLRKVTLKALDATARLVFGPTTLSDTGHRGGRTGGFYIDANSLATNPMWVGKTVQRHFEDIEIVNTAAGGVALSLNASQNNRFVNLIIDNCLGEGLRLDYGASWNTFFGTEINKCNTYHLRFTYTAAPPSGVPTSPTGNAFFGGIIERFHTATTNLVLHEAGIDNQFYGVAFATVSGLSGAFSQIRMAIGAGAPASAQLRLHSGRMQGDSTNTTAIELDNATSVVLDGGIKLMGQVRGIWGGDDAKVEDLSHLESSVTSFYVSKTGARKEPFVVRNTAKGRIERARYHATGTTLVASDVALSAGWGASATVSAISGTDQRFRMTISSAGAGLAANPTATLTFKDGTWTNAPFFVVTRNGGSQPTVGFTWTTTATTLVMTFSGTPVSGETYTVEAIGMG